jgi:hypothetical protein
MGCLLPNCFLAFPQIAMLLLFFSNDLDSPPLASIC